ncbi:hypothetical protein HK099_000645 [Clydaea vesicula]|uniref:Uncharacterized protein n=1 Tax=Clydaea vesicula TaxID=447962 RepID=A0AAD5U7P4_9FUNG|nr:hypothetical protein HK099_000645 [Clydaea vesicula]KAJ3395784.1 hypothetical protein HDU92_004947 [Lobulomyces angularis]
MNNIPINTDKSDEIIHCAKTGRMDLNWEEFKTLLQKKLYFTFNTYKNLQDDSGLNEDKSNSFQQQREIGKDSESEPPNVFGSGKNNNDNKKLTKFPFDSKIEYLSDCLNIFQKNPPFTLQRICEILLDDQRLYKNVWSYYRALEKNLSVTDELTSTVCSEETSFLLHSANNTSEALKKKRLISSIEEDLMDLD